VIALAALTLPYVPLAIWQVPAFLRGGDIGHTFYPFSVVALTLASNWTLGLDGRAPLLDLPVSDGALVLARLTIIVAGLALVAYELLAAAVRAQAERRRLRLGLAVLAWLALPALLVYVVSTRIPIFQPRYVLWSAPALYILLGASLARLMTDGRAGRAVAGLALAALVMFAASGWLAQVIHPIRPDLRGAAAFVAEELQPGDAVVFQIPYGRHGFEYYVAQGGRPLEAAQIVEAPFTNAGMSEDEVASTLLLVLNSAERVWLYETEAAMWDERGLVRALLERDLAPLERHEFRGVSVGLYEVP
jgi:hypothetical protein